MNRVIPHWSTAYNVPGCDDVLQHTVPLPRLKQHAEVLCQTLLEGRQMSRNSVICQRVCAIRQSSDGDGFVDVLAEISHVGDQAG